MEVDDDDDDAINLVHNLSATDNRNINHEDSHNNTDNDNHHHDDDDIDNNDDDNNSAKGVESFPPQEKEARNILGFNKPCSDDDENNSETTSTCADVEQMYGTSNDNSNTETPTLVVTSGALNGKSQNI